MKDVIAGSWAKLCAGTQDADGKAHKEGPLSKLCQTPKTGSGKIMHGFKVGSLAYIDNNNRLRTWDVKSKKIPGHMKISRRNAITMLYTGTNPYCWTLTDPRGGIMLNKYYNSLWRFML